MFRVPFIVCILLWALCRAGTSTAGNWNLITLNKKRLKFWKFLFGYFSGHQVNHIMIHLSHGKWNFIFIFLLSETVLNSINNNYAGTEFLVCPLLLIISYSLLIWKNELIFEGVEPRHHSNFLNKRITTERTTGSGWRYVNVIFT